MLLQDDLVLRFPGTVSISLKPCKRYREHSKRGLTLDRIGNFSVPEMEWID
jgi:hypothetical protein